MAFLRGCYQQILGPRRHFPSSVFADTSVPTSAPRGSGPHQRGFSRSFRACRRAALNAGLKCRQAAQPRSSRHVEAGWVSIVTTSAIRTRNPHAGHVASATATWLSVAVRRRDVWLWRAALLWRVGDGLVVWCLWETMSPFSRPAGAPHGSSRSANGTGIAQFRIGRAFSRFTAISLGVRASS